MFDGAWAFNADISSWNTAAATNFNNMFRSDNSFNQDISSWNVENVTNFAGMFQGNNGALSTANYDALLAGWSVQNVSPNESFTCDGCRYSYGGAGHLGRIDLVENHGWTISDAGALSTPALSLAPAVLSDLDITGGASPGNSVTVTVTNSGLATSFPLSAPVFLSLGAGAIEVLNNTCVGQALPSGGTCTFDVRATSTTNGFLSGLLSVDDGVTSSETSTVSGTLSGFATGFPNVAPVLNTAGQTTLRPIREDETDPQGTLVRDLLRPGHITDSDSSGFLGIAITSVDNTNGVWQYGSIDYTNHSEFEGTLGVADRTLRPAGGSMPRGVIESADGKFVYTADTGAQQVDVYRRHESNGNLTWVQAVTAADVSASYFDAYTFALSADGQFLIVIGAHPDTGRSGIFSFFRDAITGKLAPVSQLIDGLGGVRLQDPVYPALSADQKHIYIGNRSGTHGISIVNFNANSGELTWNSDIADNTVSNYLSGIRWKTLSPDDRNLYVASSDENAVVVFQRNTTDGSLTHIEDLVNNGTDQFGTSLSGLQDAQSLAVSAKGRLLYVGANSRIHRFLRQDSGTLRYLGSLSINGSFRHGGLSVDSAGQHLITNTFEGVSHVYAINPVGGALSLIREIDYGDHAGAGTMVFPSADMRRIYVNDHDDAIFRLFEHEVVWNPIVASGSAALLLSKGHSIRFVPNPGYSGSASFTYRAWDGVEGTVLGTGNTVTNLVESFSSAQETDVIEVRGVAPVLNNTASLQLDPIAIDETNSLGTTVHTIVNGAITDADSDNTHAIALTSVDNTNGQWQYLSFDPTKLTQLSSLQCGTNGYAAELDENRAGTLIFQSCANEMALRVYARDPATGAVSLINTLTKDSFGLSYFRPSRSLLLRNDSILIIGSWSDTDGQGALHSFQVAPDGSLTHASTLVDLTHGELRYLEDLQASPDETQIFITSTRRDAVVILDLHPTTAVLSVNQTLRDGTDAPRIASPGPIALSPDGTSLYIGTILNENKAITHFSRNPTSGAVTNVRDYRIGVADDFGNTLPDLADIGALLVSPDGRYLYTFEKTLDTLYVFRRHASGALELRHSYNAASHPYLSDMEHLHSLSITISADGRYLFANDSVNEAELIVFGRDPDSGELRPLHREHFGQTTKVSASIKLSHDMRRIYVSENSTGTHHVYATETQWVNIGAPGGISDLEGSGAGLLLSGSHALRFVPNGGYSGTADITFRAWDMSAGEAATQADTASGLAGSLSVEEAIATITVGP
jgi:surface protein